MNNIIAYSLWGNDPKYIEGAFHNIKLLPKEFPGWGIRIYHDGSISDGLQDKLSKSNDVSLVNVEDWGTSKPFYGMFWRYCIADDPTVDRFIIRDLDDRLNQHDKAAIDEWVASDKPFHIMRCVPVHNFLVMGGLWGAVQGEFPEGFNMHKKVLEYEATANPFDVYRDQRFLGENFYPLAKNNCVVHGLDFDFESGDVREFPSSNRLGGVYAWDVKTWEEGNA
tara:strand:- start:155 stop:823 length:669 start_codon:yes stop_codon:yes gene_type:complete